MFVIFSDRLWTNFGHGQSLDLGIIWTMLAFGQTLDKVNIVCLRKIHIYELADRLWTKFRHGQSLDMAMLDNAWIFTSQIISLTNLRSFSN